MKHKSNILRYALISIFCFAVLPAIAIADNDDGCKYSKHKKGEKIEKLTERLNLDESQVEQVKQIFTASKEEGKNCKEIDSKKETRECMNAKREKINGEITKILNEDQKAQFATLQAEKKAHWEEKRAKKAAN